MQAEDDLLERLDDQGLYSRAGRIQMIKDAAAEIRRLRGLAPPQTLGGMIAAIYGDLDAEDCNKVDRAWIEWRGRGTITYALSSADRED